MPAMTFPGGASGGDDLTPWERASVPLELREKAADVSTLDYEALVRRLAEVYEQRNIAAWRDGREMTLLARHRLLAVLHGDRDTIDCVLRARRSAAPIDGEPI
jgi:hypothetical protein